MIQEQDTQHLPVRILVMLSIIPAALFIAALILTAMRRPYYLGSNFDPEYAYLLNSLNLLLGKVPGHTDHPGTTLQLLGAVIVGIRYGATLLFGTVESSVETAVLTQSESYLRTINLVLNLLLAVGCYLVGYRVFRHTGRWIYVVILQATPFLFMTTIAATTRVMPEPFLLFITYLLVFVLLPIIFNQTYRFETNKESIFLGILLGLGIATKVTFVPLLLLLLLPNTFRRKVYAFLSVIITFLLVTLPIWSKYERMVRWMINLIIRDGHYGHGDVGLGSPEKLGQNLIGLILAEPVYFILIAVLFVGSAILLWQRQKIKDTTMRRHYLLMLALFAFILVVQTALTVKHPPIHYALPSMGMVGLILLMLASAPLAKSDKLDQGIQYGLLVFIMGAMVITAVKLNQKRIMIQDSAASVQAIENIITDSYSHCTIAYYYRSSSPTQALYFGNSYVGNNFGQTLEQLYPASLFYNIFGSSFRTFTTGFSTVDMEMRLKNNECILMQGTPFINGYEKYAPNLILERLDNNSSGEALYRLLGFETENVN